MEVLLKKGGGRRDAENSYLAGDVVADDPRGFVGPTARIGRNVAAASADLRTGRGMQHDVWTAPGAGLPVSGCDPCGLGGRKGVYSFYTQIAQATKDLS